MRLVVRCAVAGVVLYLTTAVCSALDLLSDQQVIAVALSGTLLIVVWLTASAAMTEQAIAHSGFRAGNLLAVLLSFCRSTDSRKHGN